jgi:hypothetical protein
MRDQSESEQTGTGSGLSRRSVLRRAGAAGVGLAVGAAAVPGTASANTVETIAFCGCSQVVVYGEDLDDAQYTAVLYCGDPPDGDIECASLTGTAERVNYEIEDQDCKIIGVVGKTNPPDDDATVGRPLSVCNQYGPQQCSRKALDAVEPDDLLDCLVDAAETSGSDTLTIKETYDGDDAEYEFTVSGSLNAPLPEGGDGLEDGDVIDGNTATGVVGSGDDTYEYTGSITSFEFKDESTRVLVNGQQVNLFCDTPIDEDNPGIAVRSGGCGPQDAGPPDRDRGGPGDQGRKEKGNDRGKKKGRGRGRGRGR